jgi:hypothetical protein
MFAREPALIIAAVAAVAQALVVLGLVAWTDAQVDSVVAAVNAVLLLVVGGAVRSRVYSPATVTRLMIEDKAP